MIFHLKYSINSTYYVDFYNLSFRPKSLNVCGPYHHLFSTVLVPPQTKKPAAKSFDVKAVIRCFSRERDEVLHFRCD